MGQIAKRYQTLSEHWHVPTQLTSQTQRAEVTLGSVLLRKVLMETKLFHSLLGFSELLQTHLEVEILRRGFDKGPLFLPFSLRLPRAMTSCCGALCYHGGLVTQITACREVQSVSEDRPSFRSHNLCCTGRNATPWYFVLKFHDFLPSKHALIDRTVGVAPTGP